ncbi:YxlC family protein [Priestia megaterium]|uniref:YxlC family protein n=1 Tax=Priestia megaterium TaxID=1404 RepID=UPI0012B85F7D|nr:YxlC family protein [Priestia megaterium]
MREENDNQPLHSLKKDWEQLESLASHERISLHAIQEQLLIQKQKQKKAFRKELCLFTLTALVILTVVATAILQIPALFIAIEVIGIIVAPLSFIVFHYKRKKEMFL